MFKPILFFRILFVLCSINAKADLPWIFKWQDKSSKRHIHKFIKNDTLIATSSATIHIHYSNFDQTKQTVLMFHGMGLNARTNWYNQIEPLSKEFNVIMPDLIYFGESKSNSNDFSVEFQVKQITEALNQLNASDSLSIIGFSYGGLTASMFNQFYPERVKKLVIIDGPVKYFSKETSDSLANAVGLSSLGKVIVPCNIKEFDAMQQAVMAKPIKINKRLKEKIIKHLFLPTKPIREEQLGYLISHQSTYQSYNYNLDSTPTLLLWGEKDGVIPLSVGKNLKKNYPSTIKLITFPNAKHDAHFSESEKVNREIIDFIKH